MPDYFDKLHAVLKVSCADAESLTITVPSAKSLLEEAVKLAMHEMSAKDVSDLVAGTVEGMQASLAKPRRNEGDTVYLEDGAGFGAASGAHRIRKARGPLSSCPLCGNLACREWPMLTRLDAADALTDDHAYHVSECDMYDQPVTGEPAQ